MTKDTFTTLVRDGTTTPITATVTLSADGKTATLKPSASLGSFTKYKATAKGGTGGIKGKAGNPLAIDKVWSFTTGWF